MRIALLEDHRETAEAFKAGLAGAGHVCHVFSTARQFQRRVGRESFDIFILDWGIPDKPGIEVLEWLRGTLRSEAPIMFVTGRDEEEDIIRALEAGADDYLVKPIGPAQLAARVRALERRVSPRPPSDSVLRLPPFTVDMAQRRILRDGEPAELTQKEYELAAFLFAHPGELFSRGHLLETIWGRSSEITTRTVDTHASRVRTKLGLTEGSGWRLTAVYLYGYRLERAGSGEGVAPEQ